MGNEGCIEHALIGIYSIGTIVPIKYMHKISAVGLFCCDKFEETPKQKVIDLSKFLKNYFKNLNNSRISKGNFLYIHKIYIDTEL